MSCEDVLDLLAARGAGLIERGDEVMLDAHLQGCRNCSDLQRDLDAELATARFAPRDPPATTWDRIERGIALELEGRGPATALRIQLACTFCHGVLEREETIYCAACLAPHHADCLETHGRCAAPGCRETRTVAPRERARPRRLLFAVIGALAVGAGGVAALSSRRAQPEAVVDPSRALGFTDETLDPAPAYPWGGAPTGAPTGELMKILRSRKVRLNFPQTPLRDAINFLQDLTGLNFVMEGFDPEPMKVNVRLNDVSVWSALCEIVELCDLAFTIEDFGIKIAPRAKLPADRALPPLVDVASLFQDDGATAEIMRRLDSQRITLNFDETPFDEAVEFLRDLTGLNYLQTPDAQELVDKEKLKVSLRLKDVTLHNALELILGSRLCYQIRRDAIFIRPAAPRSATAAADKPVVLSLTGATVPDLIAALEKQGIEAYASSSAWASRGTFSLRANGKLSDAIAALGAWTSLRTRIVEVAPGHEVLAIEGRVVSAREALTATLPRFTGAAADVRELRARLAQDLARRRAARAAPEDEAALRVSERAADLSASAILSCLHRIDVVADAPKRIRHIEKTIPKIEDEIQKRAQSKADEEREREAADAAAKAAFDKLEEDMAAEMRALVDEVKKKEELAQQADARRRASHDAPAEREALIRARDAALDAARRRDEAKKKHQDERDAALKEAANRAKQQKLDLAYADSKAAELNARILDLRRDEGVACHDLEVLRRLERGERLSEADGP